MCWEVRINQRSEPAESKGPKSATTRCLSPWGPSPLTSLEANHESVRLGTKHRLTGRRRPQGLKGTLRFWNFKKIQGLCGSCFSPWRERDTSVGSLQTLFCALAEINIGLNNPFYSSYSSWADSPTILLTYLPDCLTSGCCKFAYVGFWVNTSSHVHDRNPPYTSLVFLLDLQAAVYVHKGTASPLTAAVFSEHRAVKDYLSCTAALNVYQMNFTVVWIFQGGWPVFCSLTIPTLTVGVLEPHVLKKPVVSVDRFLLTRKLITSH